MSEVELAEIKTRARHRLVGAIILVALLVFAVPLLLDHQAPITSPSDPSLASVAVKAESNPPAQVQETNSPSHEPAPENGSAPPNPVAAPEGAPVGSNSASPPMANAVAAPSVIPPIAESNGPSVSAVKPAKAETPAKAQSPAKSDAPAKVETPAKVAAPAKADAPAKLDTPAQSDASAKVESAAKADAPTKGWFVQIGVFAEEERAKGLQDRLREKGISLQTDTIQGPRGKFTRLRAGPFVDREPASALLARIKGLGENAILVHQ